MERVVRLRDLGSHCQKLPDVGTGALPLRSRKPTPCLERCASSKREGSSVKSNLGYRPSPIRNEYGVLLDSRPCDWSIGNSLSVHCTASRSCFVGSSWPVLSVILGEILEGRG